jgi:hypothetical protein
MYSSFRSMALQPFGPWPPFQFRNIHTVSRTPWTGDQPVARLLPAHRTTQSKLTQTSVPRVRFEPTIPVFERAKTVHVTVTGSLSSTHAKFRLQMKASGQLQAPESTPAGDMGIL